MRALMLFALLLPAAALADPAVDALVGTWKPVAGQSKAIHRAIEKVTDEMNIFARGIAKDRLRASNRPPKSVSIERADDVVTVVFAGKRRYSAKLGVKTRVKSRDGDPLELTYRVSGGALEQVFQGEDGGRSNTYSRSGDTLLMKVRVFSKKLPGDIVYTLALTK